MLFSGGLDSLLAIAVLRQQDIGVLALSIATPFNNVSKRRKELEELTKKLGASFRVIKTGREYVELVKNPKFGYGKWLNPCIDCKIYMLKKAKEIMEREGYDFIATGEVLGQRPMSQNFGALKRIEKESNLKGKLLRPLSALRLPPTLPEKTGMVDRNRLLGLIGRVRKPQLKMATELGLSGFSTPSGGCLLTDPNFSKRLKDLFSWKTKVTINDIELLKVGRIFKISEEARLFIGRNEEENKKILTLARPKDLLLEVKGVPGPTAIIRGIYEEEDVLLSARVVARYSDLPAGQVLRVRSIKIPNEEKIIEVRPLKEEEVRKLIL